MKKLIAEAAGTFVIVFFGTGAIVLGEDYDGLIQHLGISVASGVSVAIAILAFARISGAHFNPAITIGLVVAGIFPLRKSGGYIISQVFGGIIASLILRIASPGNELLGATLPHGSISTSFAIEFIMTFILMSAVLFFVLKKMHSTIAPALVIGTIIFLGAYFGGPISGASMNPARSIGPAIVSGHLQHLWIYIVATTLAAVCCAFFARLIKSKNAHTLR